MVNIIEIEVDRNYWFIKPVLRECPGSGPNGEDMVILTAANRRVESEHGVEFFGEGSICLNKRQLIN